MSRLDYSVPLTHHDPFSDLFFLKKRTHWDPLRSIGIVRIRIKDPISLLSWCIKGANESKTRVDSSVHLMQDDPSDLGSLILTRIVQKERPLRGQR